MVSIVFAENHPTDAGKILEHGSKGLLSASPLPKRWLLEKLLYLSRQVQYRSSILSSKKNAQKSSSCGASHDLRQAMQMAGGYES